MCFYHQDDSRLGRGGIASVLMPFRQRISFLRNTRVFMIILEERQEMRVGFPPQSSTLHDSCTRFQHSLHNGTTDSLYTLDSPCYGLERDISVVIFNLVVHQCA